MALTNREADLIRSPSQPSTTPATTHSMTARPTEASDTHNAELPSASTAPRQR